MNIDEIRKLVEIIKENDLSEFELDEGDFSVRIRRGNDDNPNPSQSVYHYGPQMMHAPVPQAPATGLSPALSERAAPATEEGVELITSPMVGTFYRSPSPESKPFVNKGENVTPETVVCIIEAMKVMNEIQSEKKGVILEVLLEDGEVVEFGQPLFKIRKL